jgi:O-antigen/teichoic acid export membrane protein
VAWNISTLKVLLLSYWQRLIAADFVKKVIQTYVTRMLLLLIGIASSVLTARLLGPEGRGVLAIMTSITLIGVQFGNLGFHGSNTFYVAKSKNLLPILIGNSLLIAVVLGFSTAMLIWMFFNIWTNLIPLNGIYLILPLIAIPLGLFSLFIHNLLIGVQEIARYNRVDFITGVLGIFLLVSVYIFGNVNVITVYLLGLVGYIVSTILNYLGLIPHLKKNPFISLAHIQKSFRYGRKVYLSSLFSTLIKRIDLLMVSYFLGYKEAGIYAISIGLINLLFIFPEVIGMIAFPKMVSMDSWTEKVVFVNKVVMLVSAIMLTTSFLVLIFGQWIITLMYGDEFQQAAEPLIWYLPGVIVLSIEVMYRRILTSIDYPPLIVYSWCIVFIVNFILNIYFIPSFGISGAAAASSLSYVLICSSTIYLFMISDNKNQG